MSAYLILTYDITDEDAYSSGYVPGAAATVVGTIMKHGGKILVADHDPKFAHGEHRSNVVVIEFPSAESAQEWLDDEEYAAVKAVRLASTSNITQIAVNGFVPPGQ
jgi:uncharacterized protein (DUF1330 family)